METLWVGKGAAGGGGGGGAGKATGPSECSSMGRAVDRARSITSPALLGPRFNAGGTVTVFRLEGASWIGRFGSSDWAWLSERLEGWNSTGSGDRRVEEAGISPAERILRKESRASAIVLGESSAQTPQITRTGAYCERRSREAR
jgi:hypothetical protein